MKSIKHYIKRLLDDQYRRIDDVHRFYSLSNKTFFGRLRKNAIKIKLEKKYFLLLGTNSKVGENLILPHAQNIVIGDGVVIGNNCTIYHNVTIGQSNGLFPILGDNIIVYTGAKIIGGISIGDNAVIGANSVVTKDVKSDSVVVGIPAKVVRLRGKDENLY